MTHATKAIYKLLLSDYVKVSKVSVEDMLYDENDIARSMDKIEVCFLHPITVPFSLFGFALQETECCLNTRIFDTGVWHIDFR